MSDDDYEFREVSEAADMEIQDLKDEIAHLQAQLAQRDAALKAADELYDAIMDCQCNEGIEESILGYCPAKRLYAAQDAYDKARGRNAD